VALVFFSLLVVAEVEVRVVEERVEMVLRAF
jgi:hypothetical protein